MSSPAPAEASEASATPRPPATTPRGTLIPPTEFCYLFRFKSNETQEYVVTHSTAGQHILKWPAMGAGSESLPAGSANLFLFPKCSDEDGEPLELSAPQQAVLEQLIMYLAVDPGYSEAPPGPDGFTPFMKNHDSSGANPAHALLVSNTEPAVNLVVSIFEQLPKLMGEAHIGAVFTGENSLHVLAVNRRESELAHLIELASASLERADLEAIFRAQANGAFFSSPPMCFYGGTVFGYAVAFSLTRAITKLLVLSTTVPRMEGLADPNDASNACTQTGMLPLHVAVANGLSRMHDFLTELPDMPPECRPLRAALNGLSARSSLSASASSIDISCLTPLQLAAKLGDRRMFQHIMRRRATVLWVWGPVTGYKVSIEGIDSTGVGNHDVMDLVCALDASKETRGMLSHDFMQDFLYKRFLEKWELFGRTVWLVNLFADLAYVGVLAALALTMKIYTPCGPPNQANCTITGGPIAPREQLSGLEGTLQKELPIVLLALAAPLILRDAKATFDYYQELIETHSSKRIAESTRQTRLGIMRKHSRGKGGLSREASIEKGVEKQMENLKHMAGYNKKTLLRLLDFMTHNSIIMKIIGHTSAIAVASYLLVVKDINGRNPFEHLWALVALPLLIHVQFTANAVLAPFEKLGKYYIIVDRMVRSDVSNFVLMFTIFLFNYGLAMYLVSPPYVFNTDTTTDGRWPTISATQDMIQLGIVGVELPVDVNQYLVGDGEKSALRNWELFNFSLFVLLYILYLIMSLILLLNLLIAMMGDTYAEIEADSELYRRVQFAQRLMLYELQVKSLGALSKRIQLASGQADEDGGRAVTFKAVEPNSEGGGDKGGGQMFDALTQDESEVPPEQQEPLPPYRGAADGAAGKAAPIKNSMFIPPRERPKPPPPPPKKSPRKARESKLRDTTASSTTAEASVSVSASAARAAGAPAHAPAPAAAPKPAVPTKTLTERTREAEARAMQGEAEKRDATSRSRDPVSRVLGKIIPSVGSSSKVIPAEDSEDPTAASPRPEGGW